MNFTLKRYCDTFDYFIHQSLNPIFGQGGEIEMYKYIQMPGIIYSQNTGIYTIYTYVFVLHVLYIRNAYTKHGRIFKCLLGKQIRRARLPHLNTKTTRTFSIHLFRAPETYKNIQIKFHFGKLLCRDQSDRLHLPVHLFGVCLLDLVSMLSMDVCTYMRVWMWIIFEYVTSNSLFNIFAFVCDLLGE